MAARSHVIFTSRHGDGPRRPSRVTVRLMTSHPTMMTSHLKTPPCWFTTTQYICLMSCFLVFYGS